MTLNIKKADEDSDSDSIDYLFGHICKYHHSWRGEIKLEMDNASILVLLIVSAFIITLAYWANKDESSCNKQNAGKPYPVLTTKKHEHEAPVPFCDSCGQKIQKDENFCTNCGKKVGGKGG